MTAFCQGLRFVVDQNQHANVFFSQEILWVASIHIGIQLYLYIYVYNMCVWIYLGVYLYADVWFIFFYLCIIHWKQFPQPNVLPGSSYLLPSWYPCFGCLPSCTGALWTTWLGNMWSLDFCRAPVFGVPCCVWEVLCNPICWKKIEQLNLSWLISSLAKRWMWFGHHFATEVRHLRDNCDVKCVKEPLLKFFSPFLLNV